MNIFRATPELSECLSRIARASKAVWGYPDHWLDIWNEALTITPDYISRNPVYVATDNHEIVGFHGFSGLPLQPRLEHLWVLPSHLRRGIGRELFEHAIKVARSHGVEAFDIEADPNAEGFYLKMGAIRTATALSQVEGQTRHLPILKYQVAQQVGPETRIGAPALHSLSDNPGKIP